ncbi:MAG: formaldehyde-activating enzyme [Methylocella sp.]|jgi:formaldehyde-activating enzyme
MSRYQCLRALVAEPNRLHNHLFLANVTMPKIQDWNYEATKLAIARAVNGEPKVAEVIAQEDVMHHPLAAHD